MVRFFLSMEPLEDVLRRIEDLRTELSAEIVVNEEEGHYAYPLPLDRVTYADTDPFERQQYYEENKEWVVDKPRIAKPDTQKRESSNTQLQQIYDSSEWYSARYVAGIALGKNQDELTRIIEDNVERLVETARKTERIPVTEHHAVPGWKAGGSYAQLGSPPDDIFEFVGWTKGHIDDCWGQDGQYQENKTELEVPTEEAIRVSKDLRNLYHNSRLKRSLRRVISDCIDVYISSQNSAGMTIISSVSLHTKISEEDILRDELSMGICLDKSELQQVYKRGSNTEHRVLAGKALGYSRLRVWLHKLW